MDLPPALASALDDIVAGLPTSSLRNAATSLTERYRAASVPQSRPHVQSEQDVVAYAAYRMPATYAAVRSALRATALALTDFAPSTVLDAGAGPGTATWAAIDAFPSLERADLLERDERMLRLGRQLSGAATRDLELSWLRADLTSCPDLKEADLVIASYALGELAENTRLGVLDRLWAATTGVLLVVEPGTPRGFETIRAIRAHGIQAGGHVAAPCPHDAICPMAGGDWCHFSARLPRTATHRRIKGGSLSYEDEKYSYVALTRAGLDDRRSRVLRHPRIHSGMIQFELCTDTGLQGETVTRSAKDAFRAARRTEWGDEWPRER